MSEVTAGLPVVRPSTSIVLSAPPGRSGVQYDVSEHDYHSGIELSKSSICKFAKAKSPAHYRYEVVDPLTTAQIDNMLVGSVTDCLIFEPEKFAERFLVGPDVNSRGTKTWKEAREAAANEGLEMLLPKQYQDARDMALSLHSHPKLADLFFDGGVFQVSMFWNDLDIGWPLRGRLDCYNKPSNIAIDLKTAADASFSRFSKDAFNLDYHVQHAMYCDGWEACGNDPFDMFLFVVIDKTRITKGHGFEIAYFEVDADTVELGRRKYKAVGRVLAEYKSLDEWPGFPQHLQVITAPPWAK